MGARLGFNRSPRPATGSVTTAVRMLAYLGPVAYSRSVWPSLAIPREADMSESAKQVKNGVNVEALVSAREALTKAPEAAQFKWRAACEWKNGTHSHSTVESFFGL